MKLRTTRITAFFMAVCLLLGAIGGFSAFAEETAKMITITTKTDINPFIRIGLHKRTFATGGPFTVRCDMKIDSFQKTKPEGHIFVNIVDGRDPDPNNMVVWLNQYRKTTDGWIEMTKEDGSYITFNNIDKVLISGAFEEFALLQFGALYTKAVVSFRNFRVFNAAGDIVYSWNTDPYFKGLTNLKDFGGDTAFALTFGDGSATYVVSDSPLSGDITPIVTTSADEPDYEDPNITVPVTSETTLPDTLETTAATSVSTEAVSSTTVAASTSTSTVPSEPTDTTPFPIWIPLVIVGGVLVLGGGVFLVLWKMKKLPWRKSE